MSDPFERIARLSAKYEAGGRMVGWEAQDREGRRVMELSVAGGNDLLRRHPGQYLVIRDRRSGRGLPKESAGVPIWTLLREAAEGETIEVVQMDTPSGERCVVWDEAVELFKSAAKGPNIEVNQSSPERGFVVFESYELPSGVPTVDNWFGFIRAWTRSWVLSKGDTGGDAPRPRIQVVPRDPPRWPVL